MKGKCFILLLTAVVFLTNSAFDNVNSSVLLTFNRGGSGTLSFEFEFLVDSSTNSTTDEYNDEQLDQIAKDLQDEANQYNLKNSVTIGSKNGNKVINGIVHFDHPEDLKGFDTQASFFEEDGFYNAELSSITGSIENPGHTISIKMPGRIIESNGINQGSVATWTYPFEDKIWVKSKDSVTVNDSSSGVFIVLFLFVAVLFLLVFLNTRRNSQRILSRHHSSRYHSQNTFFCSYCGYSMNQNDLFCEKCGEKVE